MEDGICVSGYYFKGPIAENFFLAFSVNWFLTAYALPCACFFILYGMVAISMQRRKRDLQFESNRFDKILFFPGVSVGSCVPSLYVTNVSENNP